jgi:hypothetical protein
MKKLDPKAIERKNKAFWRKSKPEQCVAIAKDVLLQLAAKKYKAEEGTYIRWVENKDWTDFNSSSKIPDLQSFLLSKEPKCSVCAVGSAFLSMARLGDKISMIDDYHDVLFAIFGWRQVRLMEAAFEGFSAGSVGATKASFAFYDKYALEQDRLQAIFQNVIDHLGKFVP